MVILLFGENNYMSDASLEDVCRTATNGMFTQAITTITTVYNQSPLPQQQALVHDLLGVAKKAQAVLGGKHTYGQPDIDFVLQHFDSRRAYVVRKKTGINTDVMAPYFGVSSAALRSWERYGLPENPNTDKQVLDKYAGWLLSHGYLADAK